MGDSYYVKGALRRVAKKPDPAPVDGGGELTESEQKSFWAWRSKYAGLVKSLLALMRRHYGPGAHPSGSPQSVHGRKKGGSITKPRGESVGFFNWQDENIEHIPKEMGKRDVPEGIAYQSARWLGLHSEGMGDIFRELAQDADTGDGRVSWDYIEEKLKRLESDMEYQRDREYIFEGELSPDDESRRLKLIDLWERFPRELPPTLEAARQLNLRLLKRDEQGVIKAIENIRALKSPVEAAKPAGLIDLPEAGARVDGRVVLGGEVPNLESIPASLNIWETLPNIREVKFTDFPLKADEVRFHSFGERDRTERLAELIQETGEIAPLIVVKDDVGLYVLEGGHRFDALRILEAESFPALIVIDREAIPYD